MQSTITCIIQVNLYDWYLYYLFKWDPMITTLPGLYLVTVGILKPFILLLGIDTACSVSGLRLINILFQAGTFYVLRAIYKTIHSTPQADNKVSIV